MERYAAQEFRVSNRLVCNDSHNLEGLEIQCSNVLDIRRDTKTNAAVVFCPFPTHRS
jgi:hypothetical protein